MQQPELPMEIDVQSVHQLRQAGDTDFLLVDCREPEEHQVARIEGSRLIPMAETPNRTAELEPFREGRIVVHCHHGMRSLEVTQWLRQRGFSRVQSMTGGIDAWSVTIDAQVPRY